MALMDFINARTDPASQEEVGIGGFRVYARVSDKTRRTSQVPVVYLEDGSAISDHIIVDPLVISIDGVIGDVVLTPREGTKAVTALQAELGNVAQYLPERSQTQIQKANVLINDAADAVREVDALLAAGQQAVDFFGNKDASSSKPLAEQFLDAMEKIFKGKQLIAVDMPYRTHQSMAITSLETDSDNETGWLTFSITLQQVRLTSLEFAQLASAPNPSQGTKGQLQSEADKGAQEGERSLISTIVGLF